MEDQKHKKTLNLHWFILFHYSTSLLSLFQMCNKIGVEKQEKKLHWIQIILKLVLILELVEFRARLPLNSVADKRI